MSVQPSEKYAFRSTTIASHVQTHQKQFETTHRKILPIELTPSLIIEDHSTSQINPEISGIKQELRLTTYYITALIEKILETPFTRTKTDLQGSQAKKGWQAAHASFAPHTNDDFTHQLIDKIEKNGVTPTKTKPYLKHRLGIHSPEAKILSEKREETNFVKDFVLSRLPSGGEFSSLASTRYYWLNNSTFESPDEANQYDSHLEKKVIPLLKGLQMLRLQGKALITNLSSPLLQIPQQFIDDGTVSLKTLDTTQTLICGTLSAEDSVAWLATWLHNYYTQSIQHLKFQLEQIENATDAFQKMRSFELSHLESDVIPLDAFQAYLDEVNQFLISYDLLNTKKSGCPSCHAFTTIRNDFRFLKKLQVQHKTLNLPIENILSFYMKNRRHLKTEMTFDKKNFIEKYTFYLEEATAQKTQTELFLDPCVIPNLSKSLFGIMDDRQRRAPTDDELRFQIFQLFAVATPEKAKLSLKRVTPERSEESSSEDPASSDLSSSLSPKKPKESHARLVVKRLLF